MILTTTICLLFFQ